MDVLAFNLIISLYRNHIGIIFDFCKRLQDNTVRYTCIVKNNDKTVSRNGDDFGELS